MLFPFQVVQATCYHFCEFLTFQIHSVKKEDRGTYYCVADNGVGRAARRNVALDVEFPPVVTTTANSDGKGETQIGQAYGYR